MLNGEQSAALRAAMIQRLAGLRELIRDETSVEDEAKGGPRAAEVGDFADDTVGADLLRTEDALIGMHRVEAREIEAALDRLSNGRYGLCADCGLPIDFERLRANPTGRRCQPCQRQIELSPAPASKAR